MNVLRVAPGLGLGIAAFVGAPSSACSIAAPTAHAVDASEAAVDTSPPNGPSKLLVEAVHRGTGPQCDASGVCASTSCDDIGTIQLSWSTGGDDRTPDEALGIRATVVEGTAPDGLWPIDEDIIPWSPGGMNLNWIDGASDDQEAIDFTLELVEIDLAGNESEPVQVRVQHDGTGDAKASEGCSVAGMSSVGWALALGVMGVTRRRSTGSRG